MPQACNFRATLPKMMSCVVGVGTKCHLLKFSSLYSTGDKSALNMVVSFSEIRHMNKHILQLYLEKPHCNIGKLMLV